MKLPEAIKVTRKKAFLSQEAFAAAIGVSVASIIRWENGKSKPNLTAMKNMKAFCGKNRIEYSYIEDAWLNDTVEEKDNGNS